MLILTLLSAALAQADPVYGWSGQRHVPEITFVGKAPPRMRQIADRARAAAIALTEHWRKLGLRRPEKLDAIFAVGDDRAVTVRDIFQIRNPDYPGVLADLEELHQLIAEEPDPPFLGIQLPRWDWGWARRARDRRRNHIFDLACARYGYEIEGGVRGVAGKPSAAGHRAPQSGRAPRDIDPHAGAARRRARDPGKS